MKKFKFISVILVSLSVALLCYINCFAEDNHERIALKSIANNQYVCAENAGGSSLIANRTAIGPWEMFNLIYPGGVYKVSLKSIANNKYVCAENSGTSPLIANRTAIGPWETFELVPLYNNNRYALKSMSNNKYVCADNSGSSPLIANGTAIGPWETFEMISFYPDAFECEGSNDTMSTATPITADELDCYGSPLSIDYPNDVDYFKIQIPEKEKMSTLTMKSPSGLDYDIKLYNATGTEIGSSTYGVGVTDVISKTNLAAGTYYIKVFAANSSVYSRDKYNLSIVLVDDSDETNDTFSTAKEYTYPYYSYLYKTINSATDVDYYKITLNAADNVDIKLISPTTKDYDLVLYNSAGSVIGSSSGGIGVTDSITTNLAAGTYYVKVFGYNGSYSLTSPYQMKVTVASRMLN